VDKISKILLIEGIVLSCWVFCSIMEGMGETAVLGKSPVGDNEKRNIEVVLPKGTWDNLEHISKVKGIPIGEIIGQGVVAWHIYCDLKSQEEGR